MDSDWLTGLLVVLMVTIAVGLLWSGTMFGSGHTPAPIIIETSAPAVEGKDSKKKPRQRTNAQQSPKAAVADVTDAKEATGLATSSSSQDFTENNPSRSPRKKKNKAVKRDEVSGHTDVTEEASANDGTWQTQLSRQQKQELLRQRRQQENATQSSNESASPPEESIEKQIANAADEVVTTSVNDSKDDKLMYLESNDDDADAWLVISNENSST